MSEEEEEEAQEVSGSEYDGEESEESSSGSSSEDEMSESEKTVLAKKASAVKRKRAAPIPKKIETIKKESKKNEPPAKKMKKDKKEKDLTTADGEKKVPANFESGKVDFNLHTEDPNNIVQKTVQISPTLKLTCKMLQGTTISSGKVTYPDWAALIFQKKIKEDKSFEFNISLRDAPKIIEGLQFIINENKTFFKSVS